MNVRFDDSVEPIEARRQLAIVAFRRAILRQ
jgi:hypothetical protein